MMGLILNGERNEETYNQQRRDFLKPEKEEFTCALENWMFDAIESTVHGIFKEE